MACTMFWLPCPEGSQQPKRVEPRCRKPGQKMLLPPLMVPAWRAADPVTGLKVEPGG